MKLPPCLVAEIHGDTPLTTYSGLLSQKFNYHLLSEFHLSFLGIWPDRANFSSKAKLARRARIGKELQQLQLVQPWVWMKEVVCVRYQVQGSKWDSHEGQLRHMVNQSKREFEARKGDHSNQQVLASNSQNPGKLCWHPPGS